MMNHFIQGFSYARTGLTLAWKEYNFKIEVGCAVLVIALGFLLHISAFEFALVVLAISVVLAAEAFNTALEELCDKFQPTHDPHIAKIKDLGAATVLLSSIGASIVGLIIFIPYI